MGRVQVFLRVTERAISGLYRVNLRRMVHSRRTLRFRGGLIGREGKRRPVPSVLSLSGIVYRDRI